MAGLTIQRGIHARVGWDVLLPLAAGTGAAPVLGMFFSHQAAFWGRIGAGGALDTPQSGVKDVDVFEVRLFGANQEWRWLRDGDTGTAWWIAEGASMTLPVGFSPVDSLEVTTAPSGGRLLLWGEAVETASPSGGWTLMASKRTGRFYVPADIPLGRTCVLERKAYVGSVAVASWGGTKHPDREDFGNQGIVETLCVGLGVGEQGGAR